MEDSDLSRPGQPRRLRQRQEIGMHCPFGWEFHTFTIVGRCPRTGALGIALTSSPLCVAARCVFVRAHVGAVATQAYAHPGLGPLGLRLLELDYAPGKVLAELRSTDEWAEHRQIGIVDRHGNAAAFTGAKNLEWKGHIVDRDVVAMGNYLTDSAVVDAMAEAFRTSAAEILEERLLRALEAGKTAGGERGGQLSAGLVVHGNETFPRTDLRIDMYDRRTGPGDDAVSELRRLFTEYRPLIPYYEQRPTNPLLPSWREWRQQHPTYPV